MADVYKSVVDSIYFFVAFMGGVFIGYLVGFRDGGNF